MILNYGLFWRRDLTFWNQPFDPKGRLQGREARAAGSQIVDFRFQSGVYILHDSFRVIYEGQAQRLYGRLRYHTRDDLSERWDRFSWFGLRKPEQEGDLLCVPMLKSGKIDLKKKFQTDLLTYLVHLESVLILMSEPPLNRAGARFGNGVTRYAQVPLIRNVKPSEVNQAFDDEEDVDKDKPSRTARESQSKTSLTAKPATSRRRKPKK